LIINIIIGTDLLYFGDPGKAWFFRTSAIAEQEDEGGRIDGLSPHDS
jgi:hypothetical protein